MHLDHATFITDDVGAMRRFFVDIAGLKVGPRPPFRIDGYWLYLNDRPAIHLISSDVPETHHVSMPRIDHCAFRIDDTQAWESLIDRMRAAQIPFQIADVPSSSERQIFVSLAPAVNIEFVTSIAQA